MSVFRVRNLVRNNWMKITKNIHSMSNYTHMCYHYKRKENNLLSFDGYNHSQELCVSLYYFLKKNNINCDIIQSGIGNNSYFENHMYIGLKNNIILDPSYKQFLRDSRGFNDIYQNTLYEQLDDFYIGDKKNLYKIFNNMICLNKYYHKYENITFKEIKKIYLKPQCVTNEFKYLINKI
tara:strand:+ start:216 stop:752 length:537 start_codon:yes stop_codon:yes gene_type:complete